MKSIELSFLRWAVGIMSAVFLGWAGWISLATIEHGENLATVISWQNQKGMEIDYLYKISRNSPCCAMSEGQAEANPGFDVPTSTIPQILQ